VNPHVEIVSSWVTPKHTPAVRNTAGGLHSVFKHSTLSASERRNWRGQSPDPLQEKLRRLQSAYRDGPGGVG
jgi:hypothetical protein